MYFSRRNALPAHEKVGIFCRVPDATNIFINSALLKALSAQNQTGMQYRRIISYCLPPELNFVTSNLGL